MIMNHDSIGEDPGKQCSKCGEVKPSEKFHGWTCRDCRNQRQRIADAHKRANDPEWLAKRNERRRIASAHKRANDPEWPEWRAKQNECQRIDKAYKRANDPEWAAKENERKRIDKAYKRANDPEWVEREKERMRIYYAEKRHAKKMMQMLEAMRKITEFFNKNQTPPNQ